MPSPEDVQLAPDIFQISKPSSGHCDVAVSCSQVPVAVSEESWEQRSRPPRACALLPFFEASSPREIEPSRVVPAAISRACVRRRADWHPRDPRCRAGLGDRSVLGPNQPQLLCTS